MSHFIDDETDLPYPKTLSNLVPIGNADPLDSTDWNTVCQALVDTRERVIDLIDAGSTSGVWGAITGGVAFTGGSATVSSSSSEGFIVKRTGTVGLRTDPEAKTLVQNAGINEPEYALFWRHAGDTTWRKAFGIELTGTAASVRNGALGSHFEGFREDGDVYPKFRLNSSPLMTLELAAGGSKALVGGMVRTGGTTVTVTTTTDHGFGAGQTVNVYPGEANFAAGNKTVASVPSATTFTYTEAGSNVSSTAVQWLGAAWDVGIKRGAYNQMDMVIGGSTKFTVFADTVRVESGIRFTCNGSLRVAQTDSSGTPGNATANTISGIFSVAAGNSTVTITNSLIAASPKPRIFTQVMSNDTTLKYGVAVPNGAGGSFTWTGNANATATTNVAWFCFT